MYWKYLIYLLEHKKNVLIECLKTGQPIHGIIHDLSKFYPSEFKGYAKRFQGSERLRRADETKKEFDVSWLLHQHRNKHHWDYWVSSRGKPVPMPRKYVKQMVSDWRAMSRKFNDDTRQWYLDHKENMVLHKETIQICDELLSVSKTIFFGQEIKPMVRLKRKG